MSYDEGEYDDAPGTFEVKMIQYPSGNWYGQFRIRGIIIGSADPRPLDSWIPFGKRKPLSKVDAAKSMLKGTIKRATREIDEAENLLAVLDRQADT